MNISINLNKIGESIETKIDSLLEAKNLPSCLGKLTPPLLSSLVNVDSEKVLAITKGEDPNDLAEEPINDFIVGELEPIQNMSLTKKGKIDIEAYKTSIATNYVNKLDKCSSCKYIDACYKLTTVYLKAISLKEK